MNHRSTYRGGELLLPSLGALMLTIAIPGYYSIFNSDRKAVLLTLDPFAVSYLFFALAVSGSLILLYGMTNIMFRWAGSHVSEVASSVPQFLGRVLSGPRYSRLSLVSACTYGVLYAFAAGIIVFRPSMNFGEIYHVHIPSFAIATCCGSVGEFPQVIAYVTQHVGVVLLPINLVLLFSISWLVGLNAYFASLAFSIRGRNIGLGGVAALVGLFTSCPTCAGLAFISLFGGAGTLSAALFLGPLQTFFVGLSIPILIACPILVARSTRSSYGQACSRG